MGIMMAKVAAGFLLLLALGGVQDEKKFDPNLGVQIDQAKIDKTIDATVKYLFSKQGADGSWPECHYSKYGPTLMSLLAILKSGVDRDDPRIKKGFDYLRTTPLYNVGTGADKIWTYEVSILIMALEAYGEGKNADSHTVVEKINIKGNDLAWMKRLHAFLMATKHEYTDAGIGKPDGKKKDGDIIETGTVATAKKVAWRYPGTREDPNATDGYDNSNTQYAVLALKSCSRCGIKTPKNIWFGILNHFLALQQEKGEEIARMGADTQGGTYVSEFKDFVRGWGYVGRAQPEEKSVKADYGSMTAGSIGSIIIARSELLGDQTYEKKYNSAVDKSVRDGLAWIAKNWSVTENPKSPIDSTSSWNFYYLYALERIGMLAQVRNIGTHFWYKEGADQLCNSQRADGSWPGPKRYSSNKGDGWDIVNTSFALLYLKRATMIVIGTGFQEEKK